MPETPDGKASSKGIAVSEPSIGSRMQEGLSEGTEETSEYKHLSQEQA